MKLDVAPLEGITGHTYRTLHARHFPGADTYYTPFIVVNANYKFKNKEKREVSPDYNQGFQLVPQLLANKADEFVWGVTSLKQFGYQEVNLNLGCPARTVVTKRKGSGMLADVAMLERFLDDVFTHLDADMKVSVKTRIGMDDVAEAKRLMAIYNRYPISRLIVHPRLQREMYRGQPHLDVFADIVETAAMPLVYNGNIFTVDDYRAFTARFPMIDEIMVGRGLIANPALIREIQGGPRLSIEEFMAFHDDLLAHYIRNMRSDRNVLFKMKESWFYWQSLFGDIKKPLKKIRKSHDVATYRQAVADLLATHALLDDQERVIEI